MVAGLATYRTHSSSHFESRYFILPSNLFVKIGTGSAQHQIRDPFVKQRDSPNAFRIVRSPSDAVANR
jgi:hypothetical protein